MVMRPRHLLVINPNTNVRTTEVMTALAAETLEGTELVARGATVGAGPSVITTPEALAASVPHVLECVRHAVTPETAGIVVTAIGDPGVDELRALWPLPVVGIGEASVHAASAAERRFGMVTSTVGLGPGLRSLVARHPAPEAFTGLRFTVSDAVALAADPDLEYRELSTAVRLCEQRDGAEAVIIGGGPLSATARRIAAERRPGVIIQPVPSAVERICEILGVPLAVSR